MVAAAAAREFNDELTIILTSLEEVLEYLEDGHPALPLLFDLQSAAQRCVWKTAGLMEFGTRRGGQPTTARLEQLLAG
jgi:hypothetical protein